MPDQPGPEAAASAPTRSSRAVAAGSRTTRASASVPPAEAGAATPPAATAAGARKKSPAKTTARTTATKRTKPAITPSPGSGEGTVLTAVTTGDSAVAVVDTGEGLKLDETVVAGPDGAEVEAAAAEEPAAESGEFEWDDEEESEALRQARKDAELTASADSVRAYLKQIG